MYMYTVAKQFRFSASHMIDGLMPGHKCGRLHGHTYTCQIKVDATSLDKIGMVMDYANFDPIVESVRRRFDHRHINDVIELNPTAENLAKEIFDMTVETVFAVLGNRASGLATITIRISEQPDTYAEYSETIRTRDE